SVPVSIEGRLAEGPVQIIAGPQTGTAIGAISEDGTVFVGTGGGSLEEGEYRAFFRRGSAGPEVDLGLGEAAGITPDGRFAFLTTQRRDRSKIRVVPTGPGEA